MEQVLMKLFLMLLIVVIGLEGNNKEKVDVHVHVEAHCCQKDCCGECCDGHSDEDGDDDDESTTIPERCKLSDDLPLCSGSVPAAFYNSVNGKCEAFYYRRCVNKWNTVNRFRSLEECRRICLKVCELPADPGPCEALIPKYFYNYTNGKCEIFNYGGCNGNENRFSTLDECGRHCVKVCELPADPGPCDSFVQKYFYNSANGKCETFNYGGCNGNQNQFSTQDECENRCAYKACPFLLPEECASLCSDDNQCDEGYKCCSTITCGYQCTKETITLSNGCPCQNGGTCTFLFERMRCFCPTGVSGILCEKTQ